MVIDKKYASLCEQISLLQQKNVHYVYCIQRMKIVVNNVNHNIYFFSHSRKTEFIYFLTLNLDSQKYRHVHTVVSQILYYKFYTQFRRSLTLKNNV